MKRRDAGWNDLLRDWGGTEKEVGFRLATTDYVSSNKWNFVWKHNGYFSYKPDGKAEPGTITFHSFPGGGKHQVSTAT